MKNNTMKLTQEIARQQVEETLFRCRLVRLVQISSDLRWAVDTIHCN